MEKSIVNKNFEFLKAGSYSPLVLAYMGDAVYELYAAEIINGVGDNRFAPQNITPEEEKIGYANATREQAIIIATRMVKNLK